MRFLLDTYIWLWMFREPHKLSSVVHQAVTEPANDRYLPISIWEVMILLEKNLIPGGFRCVVRTHGSGYEVTGSEPDLACGA